MVDMPENPTKPNHIYLIYIYNEDLALNNQQWFKCHKTQPNIPKWRKRCQARKEREIKKSKEKREEK